MSLRLLHVSDRACGFAADTLRGLSASGIEVLSLDIRAFAAQGVYDPGSSSTFDRLDWLKGYDLYALERLQRASVLFVESGGCALSWITRAGIGKPVIARIGREDFDNPAIFVVDWTVVAHVVFIDQASRSLFEAVFPGQLDRLPGSIIPLYLSDSRFSQGEDALPTNGRRSLLIAGDASQDSGAATALQISRYLNDRGVELDIRVADSAAPASALAARRLALAAAAAKGVGIGRQAFSPSHGVRSGAADFVLCASPGLSASATVAVQAAAGAIPILRRGVTAVEEWLGPAAMAYEHSSDAAALILATGSAPSDRSEALRSACGEPALEALRTVVHRAI